METERFQGRMSNNLAEMLDSGFEVFAEENGVKCGYSDYHFVARENGEVAGILTALSVYDDISIDELIVFKNHRGKGVGRKLLQALEDFFADKGFNTISVISRGFLGHEFYEKCGFQLEFMRENKKNPKFTKYFFVKYF